MTIIHMETERVRQTARQLDQWAATMLLHSHTLRSSAGRLSVAWQGGRRSERFHQEYQALVRKLEQQIQELHTLALRVLREVEEWENKDHFYNHQWKQIATQIKVGAVSVSLYSGYQWGKPFMATLDLLMDRALHVLGKVPYSQWQGWGRWINQQVGNLKAGWVGRMNRLGHIIKSPAFKYGGPIVFGIVEDLAKGDSPHRAIGSEIAEAAIPMAIGGIIGGIAGAFFGGVGAVPGAVAGAKIGFAVYKTCKTVLAVGHIFSGALQAMGGTEQAIWLQNTLEDIDILEKMGDGLYDSIYHSATRKVPYHDYPFPSYYTSVA